MSSGYTFSRFSVFTVEHPSLDQFVLLSLMLHVLVIVLFGDTAGGGARRGEKLWGALTVTVQSLLPDRSVGLKLDRAATLLEQPTRETRPVPASPGIPSRNRDARASPPADMPQPVEDLVPPAQAPAFEMPPVISTDVEKAVTEFVVPKPSADRVYAPQVPAAEQAPRSAPAVSPSPVPPPVLVPPATLPVAPPPIERVIVPPVPVVAPLESKPRQETVIAPAPVLRPEPPPPRIENEVARPMIPAPEPKPRDVAQPVVQPAVPASAKPEREIVQPIAPPAEPKPREIPVPALVAPPAPSEPLARADTPTPTKIEREAVKPTLPPAASVSAPATASNTPRAPSGTPSGTPGADRDLLKPRVDAPMSPTDAPALGKAPGIDLDAIRRRAREINSSGTGPRTVFPFPGNPPQKPKSREQQAFDKALKKNDCRDAYADMGLAAVVPLVLSAVREDGCKW